VWRSTLGDVQTALAAGTHTHLFIKPAAGAKSFSGTVRVFDRNLHSRMPLVPRLLASSEHACEQWLSSRAFTRTGSRCKLRPNTEGTVIHGPSDDMLNMLLDTSIFPACGALLEIHVSEVKEMNSEYAVYVVDGTIRAVCTVRIFRQEFTLEDAIAFHTFAPLEANRRVTNGILLGCSLLIRVPVGAVNCVKH
jgi:hypothetical protein